MHIQNSLHISFTSLLTLFIVFGFILAPLSGQLSLSWAAAKTTSTYSQDISINQAVPNPKGSDASYEYLQLKNNSGSSKDVSNWQVAGGTLPATTTISARGRIYVCRGTSTAPGSPASCDVTGVSIGLTNTGDSIRLSNAQGKKKAKATYDGGDVTEEGKVMFSPQKLSGPKPVLNTDSQEKFDSITKAISDADTNNGDTLKVADGNYTSEGWIKITKSIDLVAESKHGAKVGRLTIRAASTTVDGFEVVGDTADHNGISVEPNKGAVSGVVIKNNYIHNIKHADKSKKDAIGIMSWSTGKQGNSLQDLTIIGNRIENIGSDTNDAQGFGVFIEDLASARNHAGVLIKDNTVQNITGATIGSNSYPGTAIAVLPELTNPNLSTSSKKVVTTNANATLQGNTIDSVGVAVSVAGDVSQFSMGNSNNAIKSGIPLLTRGTNPSVGTVGITSLQKSQSVVTNPRSLNLSRIVKVNDLHQAAYNTAAVKTTIWSNIQDAIDKSKSGETVTVGPGTYTNQVTVDKGITVRSTDGADKTTIDTNVNQPSVRITADDATFRGFAVRNSDGTYESGQALEVAAEAGSGDNEAPKSSDKEADNITVSHVQAKGADKAVVVDFSEHVTLEHITAHSKNDEAITIWQSRNVTLDHITAESKAGDNGSDTKGELDPGVFIDGKDITLQDVKVTGAETADIGVREYNPTKTDVDTGGITIHSSSFLSNQKDIIVRNPAPGVVINAKQNYWGHPLGPSGSDDKGAGKISSAVNYKPYYVDPQLNVLSTQAKAANSGSVTKNNKATVNLSAGSGGTTTVSVTLPSGSSASTITAVKSSGPTGNTSQVNNSVTYLDISADKNVTGTTTVTVKVSASKITSPQNVVIRHYTGNKWKSLSTTYQGPSKSQAVFTAQASSLSPFALVQKQPQNNNNNQSDDTDDSSSGGFVNNKPPTSTQGQVAGVATTTTQQAGKVLGAQDTNTQESLQDMLVRAKIQLLKLQVKLLRARLQ